MYRSVLDSKIVADDKWAAGHPPMQTEIVTSLDGLNDITMSRYDMCDEDMNREITDVHVEHGMVYQNRNGKDKRLTVRSAVHTVNPRAPSRYTMVEAGQYTRQLNKLQHYSAGVANRLETITGKRKAMPVEPSNVQSIPTSIAHNDPVPVAASDVNLVAAKDSLPDVLSNYPEVVEFTLDTMKSVPAGVPDSGTGPSAVSLTKTANARYAQSVTRLMPPQQ
jgi:hypothetical protein